MAPVNEQIKAIGKHIRDMRKRRGLTLKELGEQVGLSASYLSQIENGQVDLNLTNLHAITQVLGIPLISLFATGDSGGVSVTRVSDRRWFNLGEHAVESPLVKTPGNLEIYVIRLQPGAGPTPLSRHRGEELTHVIRGSVRVILNSRQVYDLQEGDVIYYLSDIPHQWHNLSDGETEILVVNTPATY